MGLPAVAPLAAQVSPGWGVQLVVDPFPPPYLSDWETNPTLASLTVTNQTGADAEVIIHFSVTDGAGRLILSGRSDRQLAQNGVPLVFNTGSSLSGSSDYDPAIEDVVVRTGRFPEGDYTACITLTAASGLVVADNICESFSTVFPDPPYLLFPLDRDSLSAADPIFEWTPVQVPVSLQPFYYIRIAEVLPGQAPHQALTANIPHYEQATLMGPALQYPITGFPFTPGRRYAWQVQALDLDGVPLSTNQGRSEIWTFSYEPDGDDPPGEEIGGSTHARLVHMARAGAGPLADLRTASFSDVSTTLIDLPEGELRIPLPLPNVAFFDDLGLSNVHVEVDDAAQAIAITATATLPLGSVNLLLLGLWEGGGPGTFVLGIEPSVFHLTEWLTGASDSPLDEFDFQGAAFTIANASRTLEASLLPQAVEQFYGTSTIQIEAGVTINHVLDLRETALRTLLAAAGITVDEAELTGVIGFDPNALFGTPQTTDPPTLDLTATLRGADLADTPDWLDVTRYTVHVTNDPDLLLELELGAEAHLPGRTLGFTLATALTETTDPDSLVLIGRATENWDAPFGIEWLSLDGVTLRLSAKGAVLLGELALGQQTVDLAITIEGAGDGIQAALTANMDELSASDFFAFIGQRTGTTPFGGDVPDNLAALRNIQLAFRSGDPPTFTATATAITFGQSTDLMYTVVPGELIGDDRNGGLIAVRLADWSLGNMIPTLRGNPIGDYQLPNVSFVQLLPGIPDIGGGGGSGDPDDPDPDDPDPDNPDDPSGGGGWSIPWSQLGDLARNFLQPTYPCALGSPDCGTPLPPDDPDSGAGAEEHNDPTTWHLPRGVNFSAMIPDLSGMFGDLFCSGCAVPPPDPDDPGPQPRITGSPGFSLRDLFAGRMDLSNLNLVIGVPAPREQRPFGWPDWLTPRAPSIRIVSDPAIRVMAELDIEADLDGPKMFDLEAELTNAEGGGIAFDGVMRGGWNQPFGLAWLALDSVHLGLAAGSVGPRVALGAGFEVGGIPAALDLDVRGTSENRSIAFTAWVRDLSTANVATFLNDAFDAGLAPPVNPLSLDSLAIGFNTADASFHLNGGFSGAMDPLTTLTGLVALLPGVVQPDMPFSLGTIGGAWFDLHVVPDSAWGGYGGRVAVGGDPGSAPFEGNAAIRMGATTAAGSEWIALELDLAGRNLSTPEALTALAGALPGDWNLPDGLDAAASVTLDSARLRMGLDTRSDSAGAELTGAGTFEGPDGALDASLVLALSGVGDSNWAHGSLELGLTDLAVSAALARAASLLPGDWSLPDDLDALAPVHLDSARLAVGFDTRRDSLSAGIRGAGTVGGSDGLQATADLQLVQSAGDSWAIGALDIRVGTMSVPEALTQAATLLPGDWTLPDALSGLTPLVLDSATLALAFDTRDASFITEMTGASHLGDDATRLDGAMALTLLVLGGEPIVHGWVRLGVVDLDMPALLNQVASLLPGTWGLPDGFTAFNALVLDSAELEVGFNTQRDSLGAHASGAGRYGEGDGALAMTADLEFERLGDASGVIGNVDLARGALTMTEALNQIADMLPGTWGLPDGLDAFDAVALDTAHFVLGFDTWTDSVFARVEGAGHFQQLDATAYLGFVNVPSGSRVNGEMRLALGAVSAGQAIGRIADLLPGDWSLPSGFTSFDALTLDSASLGAGFDTGGDSLWAGFQGGGSLNGTSAEAQLGFSRVAGSSGANGLVTLELGNVSLAGAFQRVTDLLPGDWPVPDVDFDLGNLRDAGLELGFDTRTDSIWAGVRALATLAQRDGRANLDVISVGGVGGRRSWVLGTFRLDVGDVTVPGALQLAASLVPGAPAVPTLDFDIGGITDAVLEAGFRAGSGDSAWAGLSGGFRLGRRTGRADVSLALGSGTPGGRFEAAFDDPFRVADVVSLFTGFLPGGGFDLPPLGPLDVGIEQPLLTLDFGERTGISLGGNTELFGKNATALFSLATVSGRSQFVFGVQVPDLGFTDIIPAFSNPVTDQLRVALGALTLTTADGRVEDEDLSPAERAFFQPLAGGLDDFHVDFHPGLNLTGLIPLANAGAMKDMVDMLSPGASNLMLQGTIPLPGFGNGLRDLALRAALPPMAPPGKPAWFVQGEIAVQITGRPSVGVAGAMTVDVDGDTLTFDIESNVAIVPAGVELSIAGGLTAVRPWVGPLGIEWLTLNEIRLVMGISPLAVRLGFLGDAVFGTKDIRLALGTKINIYTGVPTGLLVLGESEAGLSLGDLVSVAQKVAGPNADPISTGSVPDMAVRDLGLRIATYTDFDLGVEAGFGLSGAFLLQTQQGGALNEMGRIELSIGLDGIVGRAEIGAFSVGPVHFDDALLDLALTLPDQHLIIEGGATIDNVLSADVALAMSRDSLRFETDFSLFNQFRAHMLASAGFQITNPTFQIQVALYPEFSDELTLGVANLLLPVGLGALNVATITLTAAQTTLNGAEIALDVALWAAGEVPRQVMNTAYTGYRQAVNSYNSANASYRYHRDRCSWRSPWHCAERDYWSGVRTYWSSQKTIRWGIYVTARAVYENREFLQNNPVVDAARRALDDARASVASAQAEVNRLRVTLTALQNWVDAYQACAACGRPPIPFSVVSAEFEAALAGFFGNSRVQVALGYQVFGNRRILAAGFGGSLSELVQPLFTAVSDALF